MSAWKRVALEKLPEYRGLIDAADNPMALWIELHLKFERATDEDLIRRIFEYARWCMQRSGEGRYLSDAGTAAVCAFYEHLPQHADIRRDLSRWLTREEFANLRDAFRYHLSEAEFASFEAEFLDQTKRGAQS
jgi:hypothetical protein